jgi:glycopeptide antibiotics resistance protein
MSFTFDLALLLWIVGTVVLISPVLLVLRRGGHSRPYLLSFLVVIVYLSLVARETLVFFSLPAYIFPNPGFSKYVNLVPGKAGPHSWSGFDLKQVIINILLGVPLGFGLNFLKVVRLRTLPWAALGFGFTIEALQLVSSLIAGHPRHIADVNDMLLNAFGVVVGYGVFRGITGVYMLVRARGDRASVTPGQRRSGGLRTYLAAVMARAVDGSLR